LKITMIEGRESGKSNGRGILRSFKQFFTPHIHTTRTDLSGWSITKPWLLRVTGEAIRRQCN
jgi:hypothetical protein